MLNTLTYNSDNQNLKWYAVKIFYNRAEAVCEKLKAKVTTVYRQSIIPSYVFLRCSEEQILEIREKYREQLFVYYNAEKTRPKAIPEQEMTSFILVTSSDYSDIMFLGDDKAEYHQGERVRVIEGAFKGAEGYIKRIKRDRKLIVSINGVAAIALAYIPPKFLEKIDCHQGVRPLDDTGIRGSDPLIPRSNITN